MSEAANTRPALLEQIYSIPDMIEQMEANTHAAAQAAVNMLPSGKIRRIILTGCGDSIAACYAARQAFMELCALPVQVETAIDLARYFPAEELRGSEAASTLVVLVSNSGNVSRMVELARRIQKLGGLSLAVCSKADSPLCQHTSAQLLLQIPPFHRRGPGMRSYCACLLGLYHLAGTLAQQVNAASAKAAGQMRLGIQKMAATLREALPTWDEQAKEIAERLHLCTAYEFVGAGPDYGTAWFGFAKELEVAARPGGTQNTEDWMHMNYFVRNVYGTGTFVVESEQAPAASRTKEVLEVAAQMGRPVVCISDAKTVTPGVMATLQTPALCYYWLNPLVQCLPLAMVQAHLGLLLEEEDFRGTRQHWTACIDFATVANSRQLIVDETNDLHKG